MPQPLIKSQINVKCSETEAASKWAASFFLPVSCKVLNFRKILSLHRKDNDNLSIL